MTTCVCENSSHTDECSFAAFCYGSKNTAPIIYKEITRNQTENVLFSPFAVALVFLFSQTAADEETVEEIRNAFRVPTLDSSKLKSAMNYFYSSCKDEPYRIKLRSKLYLNEDYNFTLRPEGSVHRLDFEQEMVNFCTEDVPLKMNLWLQTHASIQQDFISRADLEERMWALLINLLTFEAKWPGLWDIFHVQDDFYKNDEEAVKVFSVSKIGSFKFAQSEELKAKFVELPFDGFQASMVVALPNARDGLFALEKHIERVLQMELESAAYVSVVLPKFKLYSKLDLKEALQKAGIYNGFNVHIAKAGGVRNEEFRLDLDRILQVSLLELDREKVSTSLTTSIQVNNQLNIFGGNFPPQVFKADHPFLFYIKVRSMVLFVGRVVDPSL